MSLAERLEHYDPRVDADAEMTFEAVDERQGLRVEVRITGPVEVGRLADVRDFTHRVAGDCFRQLRLERARRATPAEGLEPIVPEVVSEERRPDGTVVRHIRVVLDEPAVTARSSRRETITECRGVEAVGAVVHEGRIITKRVRQWATDTGAPPATARRLRGASMVPFELVRFRQVDTPIEAAVPAPLSPDDLDAEMRTAMAKRDALDPVAALRRQRERETAEAERQRRLEADERRRKAEAEAVHEAGRRAIQGIADVVYRQPGFTKRPDKPFADPPADWHPGEVAP